MSVIPIKDVVREKYGAAALRVVAGQSNACCGGAAFDGQCDPITTDLYSAEQADQIPDAAMRASLGCGNPTALADLSAGEVVLDLGSGGGIDVLLSARRVGPTGLFLKGDIEHIPLPDASVDVIISNCVINLAADKDRVLREAFRVLRPGGRFAVSDVVVRGEVPDAIRRSMELWVGCIAGALQDTQYQDALHRAGFEAVDIDPTRVYSVDDARAFLTAEGLDAAALATAVDGTFMSAFIRARKPSAAVGEGA